MMSEKLPRKHVVVDDREKGSKADAVALALEKIRVRGLSGDEVGREKIRVGRRRGCVIVRDTKHLVNTFSIWIG
jgi:hypothetical protein